ncbi:sporulation protein YdcC [Alicyclobacillus cellulosilyticus]|uniref:Sporulation protein YdcC n=1 Tax=Alicyclobacillus cellulosilyticus TaxID=1003997 RepID=A0A917NIL8_9BACL|nr:outer membrane lipoprotein carrier protein LolA [Alicyclobacillus cellulosilyticus]GGJ04010.1 sporulation protein YdcC [Alicyclobacillus cellulosilyticus]
MRKITGLAVAAGLILAVAAGCGVPGKQDVVHKLRAEAASLERQNYKSEALMTVQMDNSAQTYYIETWYEGPDTYRIALGDANKNINQVIVRNPSGMFIVSPALQKVFRFNGNWAQNQGHIYLYDQILAQIIQDANVKVGKNQGLYTFDLPISPANDVVVREHVVLDAKTLHPKQVVLYDKDGKAVVTIQFQKFETGVQFAPDAFNPHQIAAQKPAQQTMAADMQFGYVEPDETFGARQTIAYPEEADQYLLRYSGAHGFTLQESRPAPGVFGFPSAQLVDLYGVPAVYTGTPASHAHELIWINNGIEYDLASSDLTLGQMKEVALSTFAQIGK